MSSSLYWMPPPTEQKRNYIGHLKYEIARYFDEEYSGGGMDVEVDKTIIPFLKGIIAVGCDDKSKDAARLITAIEKYGKVQLIIGY